MAEPQVALFIGSRSDMPVAEQAVQLLRGMEVPFSLNVAHAHHTAKHLEDLVHNSPAKVMIGLAGAAPTLPGVLAASTMRPVIGVPVGGPVPFDSFLAVAQGPSGVPVATVGVGRGENAALLAVAMLGMTDDRLASALARYRQAKKDEVLAADRQVQDELRA